MGRWNLTGMTVLAAIALPTPASAEIGNLPLLAPQPLPMAIRDGRVAQITVQAIPFEIGLKEPAPAVAGALARLAAEVATDCFLTAQAVGHVKPGTPGDGDTLTAHRLARARAELVQSTLIRAGLPAEAVAAVWDYQFTVREPRVTLWIFRLTQGEECQDQPLRTQEEPAVAKASPSAGQPPRPIEAAEPPKPAPKVQPVVAEAAAPKTPAVLPPVEPSAGPPLAAAEIAFDGGSSFFPRGAEKRLRDLLAGLPRSGAYRFELAAGVDDAPMKGGDPSETERYNRWLAERRLARVGDWLEQHAEIRQVTVSRLLSPAERSPSVVVRVLPSGHPTL